MMNYLIDESQLVISCEHASNEVPSSYNHLFYEAKEDLNSHKGWDPGSLEVAQRLGSEFQIDPFVYPYTRLLIEPNRSIDQEQLFSVYTRTLPEIEKTYLINQYYLSHRNSVEESIRELVIKGPVLHLGIHTFTPVWNGKEREVDIGILYDPARSMESKFSEQLIGILRENAGDLRIHPNEPYKGVDDGFTTYLRTKFGEDEYLGLEIEVSQRFLNDLLVVIELLAKSLKEAMRSI